MLSEAIDSFKENIKQKIANPFLGTLLLVWVVKNWKVVYAFFFFDKEHKLQNRIDYFNDYWKEHSFIWNLAGVVFLTILILVVTYLFLALSRFISNYYENVIIPQIQKWSKGKIVTAEIYQLTLDRVSVLESKVEEERQAKNEAINEREEFEKKFYSNRIIDSNSSESNQKDKTAEIVKTEYAIDINDVIKEGIKLFAKDKIVDTIIKIRRNSGLEVDDKISNFLIKYMLIDFKETQYGFDYFNLNPSGQKFYEMLLNYKPGE